LNVPEQMVERCPTGVLGQNVCQHKRSAIEIGTSTGLEPEAEINQRIDWCYASVWKCQSAKGGAEAR